MIYLDRQTYEDKIGRLEAAGWNDGHDLRYWRLGMNPRWEYMSVVIEELKHILPWTILELGAYGINLAKISDNMDQFVSIVDPDNRGNKMYIQDAAVLPWDIEDKYYDAFVGLQVFEHLKGNQSRIFDEIVRVSKNCILSFPYRWNLPGDVHHMVDEEVIAGWTNHHIPVKVIKVGIRIIYVFRF